MTSTYSTRTINPVYVRLGLLTLGILAVGLFIYNPAVIELASAVVHREGSSHGVFVPFLSIAFLWRKREILKKLEPRSDYVGFPFLALGLTPAIFDIPSYEIRILGLILILGGLVVVFLGMEILKAVAFPLFFLITMIPLPEDFYMTLANHIRDVTLGGSAWLMSMLGIPFLKNGLVIQLHNAVLNVNIGCSGIRYLVSYFVFGLAYAYMFRKSAWSRLGLVGLTIPISVSASILRLTAIFTLTHVFGPRMAEYWPHVLTSWAVFFIVLVFCISLDRFVFTKQLSEQTAFPL
jgi:exosortase